MWSREGAAPASRACDRARRDRALGQRWSRSCPRASALARGRARPSPAPGRRPGHRASPVQADADQRKPQPADAGRGPRTEPGSAGWGVRRSAGGEGRRDSRSRGGRDRPSRRQPMRAGGRGPPEPTAGRSRRSSRGGRSRRSRRRAAAGRAASRRSTRHADGPASRRACHSSASRPHRLDSTGNRERDPTRDRRRLSHCLGAAPTAMRRPRPGSRLRPAETPGGKTRPSWSTRVYGPSADCSTEIAPGRSRWVENPGQLPVFGGHGHFVASACPCFRGRPIGLARNRFRNVAFSREMKASLPSGRPRSIRGRGVRPSLAGQC